MWNVRIGTDLKSSRLIFVAFIKNGLWMLTTFFYVIKVSKYILNKYV